MTKKQQAHAPAIATSASPASAAAVASSRRRMPSSTCAHATSVAPSSARPSISQVGYLEAAADRRRLDGELDRPVAVARAARDVALEERQPAVLRTRLELTEQAPGAAEPAARHRERAVEVQLVARQPRRHPRRCRPVATLLVETVRAVARREDDVRVVQPPRRPAQPLVSLGSLLRDHGAFEACERCSPAAARELDPARVERSGTPDSRSSPRPRAHCDGDAQPLARSQRARSTVAVRSGSIRCGGSKWWRSGKTSSVMSGKIVVARSAIRP